MVLYRTSSAGLLTDAVDAARLGEKLAEKFAFAYGYRASDSEKRSWSNSLSALARTLDEAGLGKVEVLIEYQLPQTSKRADVVLCGTHPRTGKPSYVVVELKQWTRAAAVRDVPELCSVPGLGTVLQPAFQVRGYCQYMRDFVYVLGDDSAHLAGAVFLHNMAGPDGVWLSAAATDGDSQVFTAATKADFEDFLVSRLAAASGSRAADTLLRSVVGPSRKLLTLAADEIRDREQFILLDEQKVAFLLVTHAVEHAHAADAKQVVIVTGGPGSGKSVIALSLIGELSRLGRSVVHATGSKSFTTTLRRVAGKGSTRVQSLFKYFNNFTAAKKNELDVLVADEAHRLRASSANRYTKAELRTGKSQVEELIDAARVPVFLLDEHQVVRPGEVGTVATIRTAAAARGLDVVQIDLEGQFRAGGSAAYDTWVRRLLGLDAGGPMPWSGDERYQVRVADSPSAMEQTLREMLGDGVNARMTAGFCWEWSGALENGLVADIQIGDWHRPWNSRSERWIGDIPPSSLWATDPGGFDQVGCVYTAQGFEYDWNGVIFGLDFVWRDGAWVADSSQSEDRVVARGTRPEDFDTLIRNTYKVLLTRGMAGTILYSTDPQTNDHLRKLVG